MRVLLIICLVVRAGVYLSTPVASFGAASLNTILYYDALQRHLGEYVWTTTLKPPLTYLLQALVLAVFGPEGTYRWHLFLVLTFLLDSAAVCLLYGAARRLKVRQGLAFSLCLVYSVALIPFELWRDGAHYDHYTTFLSAFFIYACCRLVSAVGFGNAALASVSGGLLVAQSTVASAVVPLAVLVAVVVAPGFGGSVGRLFRGVGVGLLGPGLVSALLVAKSFGVERILAPSNLAGPSVMLFVQKALGHDERRVEKLLVEAGAPDWYLWCYKNPGVLIGVPEGSWRRMAQAFGVCYPEGSLASGTWPFDLRPLYQRLEMFGQTRIAKVVERDIAIARQHPYLFAGFSPELSSRWIGVYGDVSIRAARRLLFAHTRSYLRNALSNHSFYFRGGARLFYRMVLPAEAGGLRTLGRAIPGEALFSTMTRIFRYVVIATYLAVPFSLVLVIGAHFCGRRTGWRQGLAFLPPRECVRGLVSLGVPVVFLAFIFCMTAGTEHDRYFVQSVPYLVVLSAVLITALGCALEGLVRQRGEA